MRVAGLNDSRIRERAAGAVLADAFAVNASVSAALGLHAKHGTAILVGLDGEVTVTEPGGASARAPVVVVPPDVAHAAACPGPVLSLLFDPELAPAIAAQARATAGGRAHPMSGAGAAWLVVAAVAHRAALARADVLHGLGCEGGALLDGAAGVRPGGACDRRVARVMEALRRPDTDRREVLGAVLLSQPHLRALFVRDVGLPIRTFHLWHRLMAALGAFSRLDATTAAHLAGFADLAHFSRTCRRMLGASPRALGRSLITR